MCMYVYVYVCTHELDGIHNISMCARVCIYVYIFTCICLLIQAGMLTLPYACLSVYMRMRYSNAYEETLKERWGDFYLV